MNVPVLTMSDLEVLLDTLKGSLAIADGGGRLFSYSVKARQNVVNDILKRLKGVEIKIEIEEDTCNS